MDEQKIQKLIEQARTEGKFGTVLSLQEQLATLSPKLLKDLQEEMYGLKLPATPTLPMIRPKESSTFNVSMNNVNIENRGGNGINIGVTSQINQDPKVKTWWQEIKLHLTGHAIFYLIVTLASVFGLIFHHFRR